MVLSMRGRVHEHRQGRIRAAASSRELQIRVKVVHPPAGVTFAIQVGKSDLLPPVRADVKTLTFDFSVRVGHKRNAPPSFLGPAVQGTPTARFIYVNSGTRAGQVTSCWDRRAKVPLAAITWAMIDRARDTLNGRVEACIAGCAGDG
jgi:hypothetical protein